MTDESDNLSVISFTLIFIYLTNPWSENDGYSVILLIIK